jgi:hypothetical protein
MTQKQKSITKCFATLAPRAGFVCAVLLLFAQKLAILDKICTIFLVHHGNTKW